ncbi:inverse autotransporter beta domain-containing protein [Salmonella enterica subsp. enterica]|nr:inverse autotransporter beta domain-containing protein [Salmonella enterica subsp. enterica]
MLGVNTFLDADIRYSSPCVAALAGSLWLALCLAFPATGYFPLTGWKTSKAVHELHDERPAYGFDLANKRHASRFSPVQCGELTYEQYWLR